jgi:membrane fusion protein
MLTSRKSGAVRVKDDHPVTDVNETARSIVARKDQPPANEPLFRYEVLNERQTSWLGTVLLAPGLSGRIFSAFAALVTAALLSLLFFGEYTRKARVNGWLVPQQGLVRIFAPQAGVVAQLYAREGMEVRRGTPLMVVSTELHSEALGATRKEIVRRLTERRDSMAAQREVQNQLFRQQREGLANRLDKLRTEQKHLEQEIDFQRARLKLAADDTTRQRTLRQHDVVTVQRLQQAEEDQLDQAVTLQTLERSRTAAERDLIELEGQFNELPLKQQTQLAEIDRNVAALEQELAEAEARRQVVITAPQDGTVTAIQTEAGGGTNTTVPLLSIVPAGTVLEAQLFSPSRSVGFVRPGQRVLLRYQAFPYQKFGFYEGKVASVSRSSISPGEVTQQLSGLSSLYSVNEPVYRITISLARQTAVAYGEEVPLQPGMQLEADVLIENRRLIEWVLDPLFTLTGKWDARWFTIWVADPVSAAWSTLVRMWRQ